MGTDTINPAVIPTIRGMAPPLKPPRFVPRESRNISNIVTRIVTMNIVMPPTLRLMSRPLHHLLFEILRNPIGIRTICRKKAE